MMHYNDVYELLPSDENVAGGAARAATLLKQFPEEGRLDLFGGDALGSSHLSRIFHGEQMIKAFNQLGLDVAVVGNHELDFGLENFYERQKESDFKWLATNLKLKENKQQLPGVESSALFEVNGFKVGVIGVIGNYLPGVSVREQLLYDDFVTAAKEQVKKLKDQGAEYIVALTHMYLEEDKKLAEQVEGIDLILGGHDHEIINEVANGVPIIKAGSDWQTIAAIKVKKTEQGFTESITLLPVNKELASDSQMQALVTDYSKKYEDKSGRKENELLGKTNVELNTIADYVRTKEAVIGNFIADAIRDYANVDVAFQNGGGIRSNRKYSVGNITLKDMASIFPFENTIVAYEVKGEDLRRVFETSVSRYEEKGGGFLQISGAKYVFDSRKPVGKRVSKIEIAGKPIVDNKVYRVATNDYLAKGNDGFNAFKKSKPIPLEENKLILDIAVERLLALREINPKIEGRIVNLADN